MAKVIPFRTRAQLNQEKRDKVRAEWLAFEEHYLQQETASKDEEMTEQEIIEDVQQHLTKEDIQNIKAFDTWL